MLAVYKQSNDLYNVKLGKSAAIHDHNIQLQAPIILPADELFSVPIQAINLPNVGVQNIYNYQLAIATTGEFTQEQSGTVADGLAEVTAIVNLINGIYTNDLGVQFTLVDNNDLLINTDANTDPYSNTNLIPDLTANHDNLVEVIGVDNFDIGHVLGTAGGGVAGLGAACQTNFKGWGYSGSNSGNDSDEDLWVDIIAHEIGHQMGAEHIYNGTASVCTTRSANSAYEVGSGSTIMSYAGLCAELNIANSSSAYYNQHSIAQMRSKLTTNPSNCGTQPATTNNHPTANAGADYTIPANTYFELTGSASDIDTGDILTYTWEQEDLGPTSTTIAEVNTDEGTGPLFRSLPPTSSSVRSFPNITGIRNGSPEFGEALPSTSRDVNFTLSVRDGQGGTTFDAMVLSTVNNVSGFSLTAPVNGDVINTNPVSITWDIANSTQAPINCGFVDIWLSEDQGDSFYQVDAMVDNTGSYSTDLPISAVPKTDLMLRVKCADNVFLRNMQVCSAPI